jgi:hypothetical protein
MEMEMCFVWPWFVDNFVTRICRSKSVCDKISIDGLKRLPCDDVWTPLSEHAPHIARAGVQFSVTRPFPHSTLHISHPSMEAVTLPGGRIASFESCTGYFDPDVSWLEDAAKDRADLKITTLVEKRQSNKGVPPIERKILRGRYLLAPQLWNEYAGIVCIPGEAAADICARLLRIYTRYVTEWEWLQTREAEKESEDNASYEFGIYVWGDKGNRACIPNGKVDVLEEDANIFGIMVNLFKPEVRKPFYKHAADNGEAIENREAFPTCQPTGLEVERGFYSVRFLSLTGLVETYTGPGARELRGLLLRCKIRAQYTCMCQGREAPAELGFQQLPKSEWLSKIQDELMEVASRGGDFPVKWTDAAGILGLDFYSDANIGTCREQLQDAVAGAKQAGHRVGARGDVEMSLGCLQELCQEWKGYLFTNRKEDIAEGFRQLSGNELGFSHLLQELVNLDARPGEFKIGCEDVCRMMGSRRGRFKGNFARNVHAKLEDRLFQHKGLASPIMLSMAGFKSYCEFFHKTKIAEVDEAFQQKNKRQKV